MIETPSNFETNNLVMFSLGAMNQKGSERVRKLLEKGKVASNDVDLTCDKTKEPPCHLEPSTQLCHKCSLNTNQEKRNP
jgi:hypothetical protein